MLDQRMRSRSPHQSDPTANTENTGSSRPAADDRTGEDGMIRSFTNVSDQGQAQGQVTDGTQPALRSRTTVLMDYNRNLGIPVVQMRAHQHGVIQSQRNELGQGQGQGQGQGIAGARAVMMDYDLYLGIPVVQMGGYQHGVIQSQRNALGQGQGRGQRRRQGQGQGQRQRQRQGQGIDGARAMVVDYDRNLGRPVVRMDHIPFFATLVPPYNQMLISSQHLGNLNIGPGPTSGFFIPRSIHEYNIRFWSDPNMVGVYDFRQETLMIQTGTPMPPFSHMLPFPNMNIGFPVVGPSVNPAFLMPRNPIHGHNMGTMPNTNMAVGSGNEHTGRNGETSHSAEDTSSSDDGSDDTRDEDSERDREHEHEHGPTSGNVKRAKT